MNKDVIVIGGGIIGCAIAYSLQKRGKSVVLLERSNLVAGASGSCDQGILLQIITETIFVFKHFRIVLHIEDKSLHIWIHGSIDVHRLGIR